MHRALTKGRTAVITGAASGIGLAAAKAVARLGMNVCLGELPGDKLDRAAEEVAKAVGGTERVRAIPTDVSKLEEVRRLKDEAYAAFGEIALVMNNAAVRSGGGPWENYERMAATDRGEPMGSDQWCPNLRPSHDRARHNRCHRQHWLEARHYTNGLY